MENNIKINSKFKNVCMLWLKCKKLSIKYSTYVRYQRVIDNNLIGYFGEYDINDINYSMVINFFCVKTEAGYTSSTLLIIRYVLKSILQFASKQYGIPMIDFEYIKFNKDKKGFEIVDTSEKLLLDKYIFTHYNPISLAIILGLYSGLRLGEICGLQWHDIDLDNGTIFVNKTVQRLNIDNSDSKTKLMVSNPKTQTSERIVPIPIFVIEYIKNYKIKLNCEDINNYIYTNSSAIPDPRNIQYHFYKICNLYDIDIHFHTLRHTYATNCISCGIDIKSLSEILGHSNVSTTLNLYVHSSIEFKKQQINKLINPSLAWN